jgi:hypothetical protein
MKYHISAPMLRLSAWLYGRAVFMRIGRVRFSVHFERPIVTQQENNYDVPHDRLVTHERYLAG